jgi:ergothioneine biosynthesis protein EgtB
LTRAVSSATPAVAGDLAERYDTIRQFSEHLCQPLQPEDHVIQSMPDVSPTKWHLAHTTWFFETFVLGQRGDGFQPFHPQFGYLFNSYYVSVGQRHCRPRRGLLSRPTVSEVREYRRHVDGHMQALLNGGRSLPPELAGIIELGLHHEQQHQELMLTDIKHVFSVNPLGPVYRHGAAMAAGAAPPMRWIAFEEGIHSIGHDGRGFAYDNESARHRVLLQAFELASRPVTSGEYQAFIDDGGYRRPELWLSDGWNTAQAQGWEAPLYWERCDGRWSMFTLGGQRQIIDAEPVCHVSYFEADAFARWSGHRLPTEFEWESASTLAPIDGNFVEDELYHPRVADDKGGLAQMFGDAWEWTASAYLRYPGYRAPAGALGEYNGKFMCNQFILRGGSCATSRSHIRRTYRNFFPPEARWQFSGFRLARDA